MKLKSLIPMLAVALFAVTASAQSDQSVGGSFGTSFDHRSTVNGSAPLGEQRTVAATSNGQTRTSFWGRLMGKNRNVSHASTPGRSHGWFHQSASTQKPAIRHGWFGRQQHTNLHSSNPRAAPAHSSGWHFPFFGRKQTTLS
jgi:hypothetical protein